MSDPRATDALLQPLQDVDLPDTDRPRKCDETDNRTGASCQRGQPHSGKYHAAVAEKDGCAGVVLWSDETWAWRSLASVLRGFVARMDEVFSDA